MTTNTEPTVTISAEAYALAVDALKCLSLDCQMALCGDWDKGDDGFNSMQSLAEHALTTLGETLPEHTPDKKDEDDSDEQGRDWLEGKAILGE